ncbi:MAG TPA: nuclear transport factor 2 family protein [Cyclobacteriaceae bacterium]|nr:nuclear transport factor 2 family protein [Cyclobacteriaceae bacterium]
MKDAKITNRLTLVIIVAVCFGIGFLSGKVNSEAHSKTNAIMFSGGPELEKIQLVTNEFVDAWIKGDATGCANTYSEDAIFMTPGQPSIQGRDAIKDRYEIVFSNRTDSVTFEMSEAVHEVIYFNDWAVMRGSGYETREESELKETYKWIILAKRQPDGKWETVWDIFNDVESI